jgi:hypothetical protein
LPYILSGNFIADGDESVVGLMAAHLFSPLGLFLAAVAFQPPERLTTVQFVSTDRGVLRNCLLQPAFMAPFYASCIGRNYR